MAAATVGSAPTRTTLGSVVAVAAVAVNLRPAIVAVGSLTGAIGHGTGLGASAISLLTTLPLLCLGGFAATASALGRRIGFERAVLMALLLIIVGIGVRLLRPTAALFVGSVVAGSGIAVANALVPALIKRDAPGRLGAVMAVYSVALQAGATVASGTTASIGAALGWSWRATLAAWGLPAVLALLVWLPKSRHVAADDGTAGGPSRDVWRSRLGWSCAAFIGLQSGVYFALTAWLPSLWQDSGLDASRTAHLMLILGVSGIVGGLAMPVLATRVLRQRRLVIGTAVAFAVGLAGLLSWPAGWPVGWAIALGLGQGAGLALALTLFALRSRTPEGAAALSGMAQSGGYLIAAFAPLLIGVLHEMVEGWTVPVAVLLALLLPFAGVGWTIGTPRYLEDEMESSS